MIKKEIEGKELKQVLHFRFSFEPSPSFPLTSLSFTLRLSVLRHVIYTIVDGYDNERETWSKSNIAGALQQCWVLGIEIVLGGWSSSLV